MSDQEARRLGERRHSRGCDAVSRARSDGLDGLWRVERLGGMLPPMVGVGKQIQGEWGKVRLGPLPCASFRVERKGERVALVYRPPLAVVAAELEVGPKGEWVGRTLLGGYEIGRFRMRRAGAAPDHPPGLQDDATGEENAHEGVDLAR